MTVAREERFQPRGGRGPTFPGPLLMLFPLLLLAAGIAYLQSRRPAPLAPPRPPETPEQVSIPGWSGETRAPSGGSVVVRLTGLHADPTRQTFDAHSLERRLGLDPGEPWRLELSFEDDRPEGEPLDLGALAVRDAEGEALHVLPRPTESSPGSVPDPLAVLLAPPSTLQPGGVARLVLWGREPGAGAELTGTLGPVPLRAVHFDQEGEPSSLASLERPDRSAEGVPIGDVAEGEER